MTLRVIAFLIVFAFLSMPTGFVTSAQDASADSQDHAGLDPSSSIGKIQKDYKRFVEEKQRMSTDYENLLITLRNTEIEVQNIQVEAVKKQLLAIQGALESISLTNQTFEYIQRFNAATERQLPRVRGEIARAPIHVLLDRKAIADWKVAVGEIELQQLSTAQRAVVQRRIETIQKGHSLQQEWMQWHSDWSKFMDRYWPHSDPERRFTNAEVQTRLEALAQADPQDFAAMITSALLLQRIGKHQQALEMIDNSLIIKHSLESTAQLAKISILLSLKKNKEAKALQLAITKAQATAPQAQQHPIDRWLKARIAASQKQYSQAEVEWKALINHKPMELEARRALAMLGFVRAEKSPTEGKRALKEAQLAMDLEPRPDWFSHFVLGAAMHAADQGAKAREVLSEAAKTATAENLELCGRLRKHIEDGEAFEWDFILAGSLLQAK